MIRPSARTLVPAAAAAAATALAFLVIAPPPVAEAQSFALLSRTDYAMGAAPAAVALGRLNADAHPDLVTANRDGNSVSVRLNSADGFSGFGAQVDYAVDAAPVGIALGDVNGDGKLDVVTANSGAGSVTVLLGDGLGGLGSRIDIPLAAGTSSVTLADFDGDGDLDLAATHQAANLLSVLLGDGLGGFGSRVDHATGLAPACVTAGDIDGDGAPDLAVSGGDAVEIRRNDGSGAFGAPTSLPSGLGPRQCALSDLNNDGKLDLAVANSASNTVSLWMGDGAGGFGARADLATSAAPLGVAVGDVDFDGKADLTVSHDLAGPLSVIINSGTTTFGAGVRSDFPVPNSSRAVAIGDVNLDGRIDLVTAGSVTSVASVLLGNAPHRFGARSDFATTNVPVQIATGDFNGDGILDVASVSLAAKNASVFLTVPLADGKLALGPRTDLAPGLQSPDRVAVGDINGDGRLDLAFSTNASDTVSVFHGNGSGGFGARVQQRINGGVLPRRIELEDLNGDGRADLVMATNVGITVMPGTNSLVTPFLARTDYPVVGGCTDLALGDLNADGKVDAVGASGVNYSVALGNGAGGFAAPVTTGTGVLRPRLALGDWNGDGALDLVMTGSTTLGIFPGNGAGGFGAGTTWPAPGMSSNVDLEDVDGDGRTDVVGATVLAGATVQTNNGVGGVTSGSSMGFSPSVWTIARDLNGDGRMEILASNSSVPGITMLARADSTRNSGTLTTSAGTVVAGSSVTLSVVVPVAYSFQASLNRVRFYDGTTQLGTVIANNQQTVSLTTSFTRPGTHVLTAVYSGELYRAGWVTPPVLVKVVPAAATAIRSIADVPADQGGQVRIEFGASGFDVAGSGTPITQYEVYRQIDPGLAARVGASPARTHLRPMSLRAPMSLQLAGWDYVGSVAAHADTAYSIVVPTLADSNGTGPNLATFLVRAATANPATYFDSAPDSGYSVDDTPPVPPSPFLAVYEGGATHLHWGMSVDADFWYFALYRGDSEDFVPGPATLVTTLADTGYVDVGPPGGYYKLSAVDVNGNQGAFASLTPASTTDVAPGALVFSLGRPQNPSAGGRVRIAFTLPGTGRATLVVTDVSGRRVERHEVGGEAGSRSIELGAGRRLAGGVYFVRLAQGANVATTRVTVLE